MSGILYGLKKDEVDEDRGMRWAFRGMLGYFEASSHWLVKVSANENSGLLRVFELALSTTTDSFIAFSTRAPPRR
jgi:hypothetical protein